MNEEQWEDWQAWFELVADSLQEEPLPEDDPHPKP